MSTSARYRCRRVTPWAATAALGVWLWSSFAPVQAETVTVYTRNGHGITGELDSRSDEQTLWLRVERPGITLVRSFARAEIDKVETVPPATGAQPIRVFKLAGPPLPRPELQSIIAPEPTLPIASIAVEAIVANWDADVEADGILLTLYAIDRAGQVVPIDGSIDVELIGEGQGSTALLRTFPVLGRWVRQVRAGEFGPQSYQYRFDFQTIPPDFDQRLGMFGLVHARLVAPGHGTFDASTNAVTLRVPNPMRDRLQQYNNQRFFYNERTGNSLQQQPQVQGL
ncbi:MAG: hypothetical protein JSS27_05070 [Planctomycetes bacterium]|nr:hypothetical protein [Planctomycetota bacterium]